MGVLAHVTQTIDPPRRPQHTTQVTLHMRCVLRHTVSHAQTGATGIASPRGALQGLSAPSSSPPVSAKLNSIPPKDTLRCRERPAQGWAGIINSFEPSSSHLSPMVRVCGDLIQSISPPSRRNALIITQGDTQRTGIPAAVGSLYTGRDIVSLSRWENTTLGMSATFAVDCHALRLLLCTSFRRMSDGPAAVPEDSFCAHS